MPPLLKPAFFPVSNNPLAHGIYYLNKNGVINFQNFKIEDYDYNVGTNSFMVDLSVSIPEDFLICGLMLDFCLINPFADLHAKYFKNPDFGYDSLRPLEVFLFKSTNVTFKLPEIEYRTANIPFRLALNTK